MVIIHRARNGGRLRPELGYVAKIHRRLRWYSVTLIIPELLFHARTAVRHRVIFTNCQNLSRADSLLVVHTRKGPFFTRTPNHVVKFFHRV